MSTDADTLPAITDDELAQFETPDPGTEAPNTSDAAPSTEDPAVTPLVDAPPRDETGRFAKKAVDAPAGDALPAKPSAAQPAAIETPVVPAASAPQWSPLVVTADREQVPIDGAHILRENGHAMIVVPDAKLGRVQELLSRGIHSEKTRRQFDEERKTFAAERAKPQPPSDAEIEAKVVLEILKPRLPELFDEAGLEWLADKVSLAKYTAEKEHATKITAQQTETQQTETLERQKTEGLANAMVQVWTAHKAQLPGLTDDDVRKAYAKLTPFKNSLYTQENGEWFVNSEALFAELKERSEARVQLAEATRKAAEAAKFNQRQVAPVVTPPVPGRKGPVTATAKIVPLPKDFDEAKFLRGGYDTE